MSCPLVLVDVEYNPYVAHLKKGYLHSQGIEAFVFDDYFIKRKNIKT